MVHNDVIKILKEQHGGELSLNNGEVYFLFTKDAMVSVYLDEESRTLKVEIDGLPEDNYKVYHSDVSLGLFEPEEDESSNYEENYDLIERPNILSTKDVATLDKELIQFVAENEINTIRDLVKKHPSLLNYDYKWLNSPNYRALGTAIGELGYKFKHSQDYHGQSDYNDIKAYYNVEIIPNGSEE